MKYPFEHQGYRVVEHLRDSGRNAIFTVEKSGQRFFAKQTTNKEPVKMENDVWWMLTMQRLAGDDSPFRAPKLVDHGAGWFVSEYIENDLLAESKFNEGEKELLALADPLVDSLAWLDKALIPQHVSAQFDLTNSAPYNNLMKKIDTWLEAPLAQKRIILSDVIAAKELIQDHQKYLQPAFAHGDFVPWHFFKGENQLILFDGEHSGLQKPKYYDLAYIYTRLYTRTNAPTAARAILRKFISAAEISDRDVFMRHLLPVMTLRALGMQADAWAEREQYDYKDSAVELLQRCLSRDLDSLLLD